jgi:hypothetical protein
VVEDDLIPESHHEVARTGNRIQDWLRHLLR